MSIAATKLMTADEFFELPEPRNGAKQELVKGEVVEMAAPDLNTEKFKETSTFSSSCF